MLGDIWGSLASGLLLPPACRLKLHSLLLLLLLLMLVHPKLNPFPMLALAESLF